MAPTYTCVVDSAGPDQGGDVYLFLKDIDGAIEDWYMATPAVKKETLATALAAMAGGVVVLAVLDSRTPKTQIRQLFRTRTKAPRGLQESLDESALGAAEIPVPEIG